MTHDAPRFAAALSTSSNLREAAREAAARAKAQLGATPHLAVVFASSDHADDFAALAEILSEELGTTCLLGCTGESILCNGQ
jgi:small ligand-binding sensory domain FIST